MQGSGKVRDLREAATQSTTLQSLLTQFSIANLAHAQLTSRGGGRICFGLI